MSINTAIRDYHYNNSTSKGAFLKKILVLVARNLFLFLDKHDKTIHDKNDKLSQVATHYSKLPHTTVTNQAFRYGERV